MDMLQKTKYDIGDELYLIEYDTYAFVTDIALARNKNEKAEYAVMQSRKQKVLNDDVNRPKSAWYSESEVQPVSKQRLLDNHFARMYDAELKTEFGYYSRNRPQEKIGEV